MFKFLLPALAAGFLCLPAVAGTVFIQHTFDLGLADTVTPTQLRYTSDEFAPLTIHQGDTVELDYSFLPGQAVGMASANGYQLFNLGLYQDAGDPLNTSNFSIEGLQMALSGVAGATLAPLPGFNQSGGTAHLGALFGGPYLPAHTAITFTGIRARFVVGELENGHANYNAAFFSVGAANVGVAEVAIVPEPGTYAMFGAGLAMLALASRRRTAGEGA